MTERIFLHFVECCQHMEFCTYQVQQLHNVMTKIYLRAFFLSLKTVKREARHVDGKAVLRWMWHVASERYRIVHKRLVGICGCVLWMVG